MLVVKTFSATRANERDQLGDRVTEWLRGNPSDVVVSIVPVQSSDQAFHCLTLIVSVQRG